MDIAKIHPKEGFIKRWVRALLMDCLIEHDRGKYVTIFSNRKPDERDILYSPGAQWHDSQSRKRYVLKEIKATWTEIEG